MNRFKNKRLLMLGTSTSSVELVKYAQSEGAYVIVIDYLSEDKSAAKRVADETAMISVMDIEVVCEFAIKKKIDAVFCGVSEPILIVMNQIAEKLRVPCYFTKEQWKTMSDKKIFKDVCKKYNVPVVPEYKIDYNKESYDISEVQFPVVVKPVDSSGSRGISICKNEISLKNAIEKALEFSASKKILIEKYITDGEVVMYYSVQNGKPIFTTMCDRYTNKEQGGLAQLPTAYIFPSKYINNYIENYDKNVKKLLKGVGLQNGVLFIQSFIDDEGKICVYENGYRLNGAQEHYIIDNICGYDAKKAMMNYAINGNMGYDDIEQLCDPYLKGKYACKLSPLIGEGTISKISGLDKIEKMSSVIKVVANHEVGDIISKSDLGTLKQIAYRAFIVEDSYEKLKLTIDEIQETVKYYNSEGKSMMLKPFNTEILKNYK